MFNEIAKKLTGIEIDIIKTKSSLTKTNATNGTANVSSYA
jgi:hypothetical protein